MVGKADLVAFPRGIDNKVCRGKKTSQKVKVSQFEVQDSEVLFVCVCVLPLLRLKRKLHMYLS